MSFANHFVSGASGIYHDGSVAAGGRGDSTSLHQGRLRRMRRCLLDCLDVVRGGQDVVKSVTLSITSQVAGVPVEQLHVVSVMDDG